MSIPDPEYCNILIMPSPMRKKIKDEGEDYKMMVEDVTKLKPNVVQAVLNKSEHCAREYDEAHNDEESDTTPNADLGIVKNEPDKDESEYAQSLPDGWEVKTVEVGKGSIIKHFVNEKGRRYVSRIDAIRTLSKLEDQQGDVDILRSGLGADGWISHPLLPRGWFAKPAVKNSGNNSLRFFTEKNEWFVGVRKAVKLMENNEDYTGTDIENLNTFCKYYSSIKRSNDDTWIDDEEYLPDGWRYKICHGPNGDYAKVISPSGDLFTSKSKALAFMVNNGSDEADIVKMRSALAYDGWEESQYLPLDWRYRKCKTGRNEYNFLSPSGEMFPARKTLVEFMQSREEYTEEDIANVYALQDEIRAKWTHDKHDWMEEDETVPPGWKIRYFDGMTANKKPRKRCYILSPCGSTFQLRAKALQFMIQNNHPEDQINYMFTQLEIEGWTSHPDLPRNWRIKQQKNRSGHLLFTSEGLILSLKSALRHMEQYSEKYSTEDSNGLVFVTKGFAQQRTEESVVWLENDSVPSGWKVRGSTREYFLTPDGNEIFGRVKTIQFLLKQGRSLNDSDVAILRGGLVNVGWQEDTDIVPFGWMKKEIFNKPGKFKFISPELKEFHSLGDVYHFMRANNFPSEDINKAKENLDIKSMLNNKRMPKKGNVTRRTYEWQESDVIPPGWKVAERKFRYGRKRLIYLSPCGLLLQKAVLAFQLMIEQHVKDVYLEQMYKQLKQEGWEEDLDLPPGWRFNIDPSQFPDSLSSDEEEEVLFLTEKGKILTRNEAWKLFSDSRDYTKEQLSNFLVLLDKLSNGLDKSWIEDESLPEGWKLKDVELGYKKDHQLLSPDKEEFESFLSAFIHMNQNKNFFEDEAILKMKLKLTEEGFEEDLMLPSGWLIARNRNENSFELLSKEGVLYQTLDEAQEFMENSDEYNDKHVLDMEDLCMGEVESYLSNRAISNPNFARFVPGLGPNGSLTKVKFKVGETKSKKRKYSA